jgi:hypothetical protein
MSTLQLTNVLETEGRQPSIVQRVEPQPGSTPAAPEPATDFAPETSAALAFGGLQTSYGLLTAFDLIARRGSGECAWAAPLGDDPIAFLLDSISDAANLWSADGARLCRNRASVALGLVSRMPGPTSESASGVEAFSTRGRRYQRRCLRCRIRAADYVLEIVRELP